MCRKSLSLDYKSKDDGCSFAKVKSCVKLFCAHLFSHVGLSALVVGYSIIGAFVFSHLEGANEIAIRVKVGNNRMKTLDELYNITGMHHWQIFSLIMIELMRLCLRQFS